MTALRNFALLDEREPGSLRSDLICSFKISQRAFTTREDAILSKQPKQTSTCIRLQKIFNAPVLRPLFSITLGQNPQPTEILDALF